MSDGSLKNLRKNEEKNMNKVILMGRLTKNPEIKYAGKDNNMAVARYTLAVNRRFKKDGEQEADFISCVAFGKSAEFVQKYLHKGTKILINGRINTGRYEDKDGKTIYTTDVIVEEHEFAESKGNGGAANTTETDEDGFMAAPEGENLPFD
jgi:single-strand DNA-binding protein